MAKKISLSKEQKARRWDSVKQGYMEGQSINSLARDFSISKSSISDKAKNEQWKTEQQKANTLVRKNVDATITLRESDKEKRTLSNPTQRAIESNTDKELRLAESLMESKELAAKSIKSHLQQANSIIEQTNNDTEFEARWDKIITTDEKVRVKDERRKDIITSSRLTKEAVDGISKLEVSKEKSQAQSLTLSIGGEHGEDGVLSVNQ